MDLSIIQPLLNWIEHNPHVSWVIIFIVATSESLALVGIVVPGVVFMLGIGALVGLNAIPLQQALLWAVLGAICGDWVSYWLGRHFDRQLRHVWPLSRYPQLITKGEEFFRRHGGMSVLFGRFVGPLRPVIPAIAGIMHMPQGKFYFINILSALFWAPVVILPGVAFGESLQLANQVFGRIILIVVVLIIVLVVSAYLFKKVFSYALMISIDTVSSYFGVQQAKENIASLSLMAVLVSGLSLFVYQYDLRNQPIATIQQTTSYSWWQDNWRNFSMVHIRNRGEYPITLQWWDSLVHMEQVLHKAGWNQVPKLNIKSSMNYLLPKPEISKLPLPGAKLFNHKEALLLVYAEPGTTQYWVIRLWAANPATDSNLSQLWLGTVYGLQVYTPLDLVHLPLPLLNYSQALTELIQRLTKSDPHLVFRNLNYPDVGISDNWRGEVLLLHETNSRFVIPIRQYLSYLYYKSL